MDIATHALIGTATAAGLFHTQPALAVGLVLGNVAPDLDVLSRVAGKHAFLLFHQTYTHSAGAIATVFAVGAGLLLTGFPVWGPLAIGLAIGMAMHVGLDLTNSYGVRCLWPFSQKRFALDWIFFIDAPVLALCLVALAGQTFWRNEASMLGMLSVAFVFALCLVCACRGLIARRARRLVSSAELANLKLAIIPTTWSPFKFLVCRQVGDSVVTYALDSLSGQQSEREEIAVLDDGLPPAVVDCREWRVMRGLSSFYHCVGRQTSDDQMQTYISRDLRIRNFRTKFGTLTCRVDSDGMIDRKTWEV